MSLVSPVFASCKNFWSEGQHILVGVQDVRDSVMGLKIAKNSFTCTMDTLK